MSLTAASLQKAMPGCTDANAYRYLPHIIEAMLIAECTTSQRASMFLANCGEETGSLNRTIEWADGTAYDRYINPAGPWQGLGNIYAGDGHKFRGEGIIQVTGRANTTSFNLWCWHRGKVPTKTYLIADPTRIGRSARLSALAAAWYWVHDHPRDGYDNLNEAADAGDVLAARHMINGGEWGLDDVRRRYGICRSLGDAILPGELSSDILPGVI